MIQVIKLNAVNFLSFQDVEYNILQGKPVLIQGKNNSEPSQESNGSGKSSLQSILEFLILHTTSRKVRDIELIRRGEKEAIIVGEFYCQQRKQTLLIKKNIKSKGSATIDVSINEKEASYANVNDYKKAILEWFDISSEDLQNFFIVNKDKYTSFFKTSNTKKLDTVSRFSNINLIDGIDEEINTEITPLNDLKQQHENSIISLNSKLEEYGLNLQEEKQRDINKEVEESKSKINNLIDLENLRIKTLNSEIEEQNKNIKTFDSNIEEINTSLKEFNVKLEKVKSDEGLQNKYKSIEDEISSYRQYKSEIGEIKQTEQALITSFNSELNKFNTILNGSITCPNCDHEFSLDYEGKLEDIKEYRIPEIQLKTKEVESKITECGILLQEVDNNIELKNSSLKEVSEEIDKFNEEKIQLKESINDFKSQLSNYSYKLNNANNIINNNKGQIISCKNKILSLSDNLKTIEKSIEESVKLTSIEEKIKITSKEISSIENNIKDIDAQISEKKEWIYNFKSFRSSLAQECLLVIQQKINFFLNKMGSEILLTLEGFKQKANGDIKEEITPYIIKNGETCNFYSLSGGEKVRVDLACIAAFQDIINETNKYGGLDILWLDEITESLDPLGVQSTLQAMEYLDKTIQLTTHIPSKDGIYENVTLVENNNGISTIKID